MDQITAEGLANHTLILASDEFEGRLPASKGEEKTLKYLEEEFTKLGLEPGGDLVVDSNGNTTRKWTQDVELAKIIPISNSNLFIQSTSSSKTKELKHMDEFVSFSKKSDNGGKITLDVTKSEIVFVGYGIVAKQYGWNDYEGLDVRGKTVVVLVNDPGLPWYDNEPVSDLFEGTTMTYYGRWTYKYEEAGRQGAKAVLIVHNTKAAAYPFSVCQQSKKEIHFWLKDNHSPRADIEGWLTEDTTRNLFALCGMNFDSLRKSARERGFKAQKLPLLASMSLEMRVEYIISSNFLAVCRGEDTKHKEPTEDEEVILYSAHWDHFGKDLTKNCIYNGARDNALSVAALLELAKAFSALQKQEREVNNGKKKKSNNRTVVFFSATAEEQGLLGSEYYTLHPLYPLSSTVACLNMDMLNIFGPTKDVAFFGKGKSELDDYALDCAKALHKEVCDDPLPHWGLYYRSDHFPFAKKGVPGLFLSQGYQPKDTTKGETWILQKSKQWNDTCYHTEYDVFVDDPNSEWCWDLAGSVEDVKLFFLIGLELLQKGSPFPQWRDSAEFSREQPVNVKTDLKS
eukprot:CAMPEP_0174256420 /NCGR_PEP_ID=MMETSP0439-20130205/5655_1 /TAXON_ID=0 /ORGANISM="Stereomyxa ramosa, Strain Chinc5" /LENGTH=569 /DNA_ID=CAMNT_0015339013 /DNA_START=5 /DNA_END=1711 /DNA_ORIENTATION=-